MKTRSASKSQSSKRLDKLQNKNNSAQRKKFSSDLSSDSSDCLEKINNSRTKTKNVKRQRLSSDVSCSAEESEVSTRKIKKFKRQRLSSDVSCSSEESDISTRKTKKFKRQRLSSDVSCSAEESEVSSRKTKKFKCHRLSNDVSCSAEQSEVSSRKTKKFKRQRLSSDVSCSSEESDIFTRKTKKFKRQRLSSDVSCSSEESDIFTRKTKKFKRKWLSSDVSCSAEESDVSARKTKKSKRIRFLKNTLNLSDEESEQLDIGGLLKYKLKKLRWAVSYNNAKQVQTIIAENYVKLNSGEFGSLLWRALENKNVKIIDMLVRAGVDVNVRGTGDDQENTLLHAVVSKATSVEFEQLVLLLIEYGADIKEIDGNGNTVLHCAIESGSFLLIQKLLDLDADIDAVNYLNQNILYVAAKSPRAEKLLPLLVQHNVPDLKTRNRRAMIALGYLVTNSGDLAAMKALLDLKVPINEKNDRNSTLLDYAVADRRSFEIVKLLLEYGADPSKKRNDGNFYLCLACSIRNCSMAALLIKNGARLHVCNDNGQYPIHEACKYGSLQNIALLLFLGANVNNVDNRGFTPFSLMSTYYLHDCSKFMIKHFAILTTKNMQVNQNDLSQVYTHPTMNEYYDKCLDELRNMKTMKIYNNVTAYSILTQSVLKLTQLIRNKDFVKNYYHNLINILTVFPIYSKLIEKLFNVALKVRKAMVSLTDTLDEATNFILPEEIWEIITFYSCCHRLVDFYV